MASLTVWKHQIMPSPKTRLGRSASVATNVSAHRLSRRIAPADPPPPPPPAEPSELDKAQAAWSATTEQMAGFRAATLAFNTLAKDAERVRISRPVGRMWSDCGGDAIEGPWDGEEAITLLPDLDAGATGAMNSAGSSQAMHRSNSGA